VGASKPPSDDRYAFLRDPDLYDLVKRVVLRIVRGDEAFAEDIRQGAYEVAMRLVRMGRGPKPGMGRGWMCRVTKFHAFAEIRRRKMKEEPPPPDPEDTPDIPVEHHQELYEQLMEAERLLEALDHVAAGNPEQVAQVLMEDGRKKKEGDAEKAAPKDAATRKRKERARAFLQSRVTAAVAAAVAAVAALLFWIHTRPQPIGLPPGGYATLADASHELAHRSCAAKKWVACLEGLEQTERLDPSKIGPAEQGAWKAAVAAIRQQAFADCEKGDLVTCLEELDTAKRFDAEGDSDPSVTLARADAEKRLQAGGGRREPPFIPDAKEAPKRRQ